MKKQTKRALDLQTCVSFRGKLDPGITVKLDRLTEDRVPGGWLKSKFLPCPSNAQYALVVARVYRVRLLSLGKRLFQTLSSRFLGPWEKSGLVVLNLDSRLRNSGQAGFRKHKI